MEEDSENLWILMQKLAIFENYIDSFEITPEVVRERGFKKSPPDFYCLLADDHGIIAGMLVYYFLPYTAQNRPAIFMKELYVEDAYRGLKIGERLMHAIKQEAKLNNCKQVKWGVAPWNEAGLRFYHRLGAVQNNDWLNYEWNID